MKNLLEEFLSGFSMYADFVFDRPVSGKTFQELASQLKRLEPQVTRILLDVSGDSIFDLGWQGKTTTSDVLTVALMGGNNAMPHNFGSYYAAAETIIEKTLGILEGGLWPPEPSDSLIPKRYLLSSPVFWAEKIATWLRFRTALSLIRNNKIWSIVIGVIVLGSSISTILTFLIKFRVFPFN